MLVVRAREGFGRRLERVGVDVDEDGLPDVFYWSPDAAGLYRNQGQLEFDDIFDGSGILDGLSTMMVVPSRICTS